MGFSPTTLAPKQTLGVVIVVDAKFKFPSSTSIIIEGEKDVQIEEFRVMYPLEPLLYSWCEGFGHSIVDYLKNHLVLTMLVFDTIRRDSWPTPLPPPSGHASLVKIFNQVKLCHTIT